MRIQGPVSTPQVKFSPELERALQTDKTSKSSSGDLLSSKLAEVDQAQKASDTAMTNFSTGKTKNLHEVILAMEMADTSLRTVVAVRNKAIEAYQEIMRMPV